MSCKKDIIKRLARARNDDDFKSAIRSCKCDDIQKIVKMLVLVMSKKVPVSKRIARFLREDRKYLRHLVHPQYSWKSKRRYLMQSGGTKGFLKNVAKVGGKTLDGLGGMARSPVVTRALGRELAAATTNIPLKTMKGMTKSTSNLTGSGGRATTSLTTRVVPSPSSTAAVARRSMRLPLVPPSPARRAGRAIAQGVRRTNRAMRDNPVKTVAAGTAVNTGAAIGIHKWLRTPDAPLASTSGMSRAQAKTPKRLQYEPLIDWSHGKPTKVKRSADEAFELRDMPRIQPPPKTTRRGDFGAPIHGNPELRTPVLPKQEGVFGTAPRTKQVTAAEAETSFTGNVRPSGQSAYQSAHSDQASFDVPAGAGLYHTWKGMPKESIIVYGQPTPERHLGYRPGSAPDLSKYDRLATQAASTPSQNMPRLHKFDTAPTPSGSVQSLNA